MKFDLKKRRNRALLKDRPEKKSQCRFSDITVKSHPCHPDNGGHHFQFYREDNYGWCKQCGDEILT